MTEWARIKVLFAAAMEQPAAERMTFVERACGEDQALRREVMSLLAASDGESLSIVRDAIANAASSLVQDRDASVRTALEKGLGHQYELIRHLGRGGMGEVFLARERALERLVAIKVLRPDLAVTTESRERFKREARTAAQLSHRSIVSLHTFGEVAGVWFFVMQYIAGETLAERLHQRGRINADEARDILIDLADALDCAHQHGVIHRDIKPANILLDAESGRAVLADFGISKTSDAGDSLTVTGAIIGTPDYMSPEQVTGAHGADARSDIYSLGAVAYTMLAGRAPFAEGSAQAKLYRRASQDATPIGTIVPSVPGELAEIVMKCLARDPALRWPDARMLKAALVQAGGDVTAMPEQLRQLPTFAPYALLWAVAWTAFALWMPRKLVELLLLLLIALLVPLGLSMHVWHSGGYALGMRELARVASWPPEWWGMWWPRVLRRPSDVWARLPWWPARFIRIVMSAFFFAVPLIAVLGHLLDSQESPEVDKALDTALRLVAIIAATSTVASLWWARRAGFSGSEATRFLFGATLMSRFWSMPRVARLLSLSSGRVRSPDRDSPSDHHRAIDQLVRMMPSELTDVVIGISRAAEDAVRAIKRSDNELKALQRELEIAEPDRIAARLVMLGDPRAGENTEGSELRQLLQKEVDVARRVRAHGESVRQERDRQMELLRTIYTQLRLVHEPPTNQAAELAAVKLRTLCQDSAALAH